MIKFKDKSEMFCYRYYVVIIKICLIIVLVNNIKNNNIFIKLWVKPNSCNYFVY